MAHSSGQMKGQGRPMDMCDYCHQQPKFPPYDYCSKACGSRAKGSGNSYSYSKAHTMCKQCGQRPVYKNHEFCGKNCANNWQAMYGSTGTNSYGPTSSYGPASYGSSQPQYGQGQSSYTTQPKTQYPPGSPSRSYQSLGQGNVLTGMLKGLASQTQQLRLPQQFSPNSFSHMQQVPGHISPPPLSIPPQVNPMSSGMSGPVTPGSNQQYYTPPLSPSLQDPNANGLANPRRAPSPPLPQIPPGQNTNMAVDPPIYSANNDQDLEYSPYPDSDHSIKNGGHSLQAEAQTQSLVRVAPPYMRSGGNGSGDLNPSDPDLAASLKYMSNSSSTSSTCRLNGCNKPVFVDPATNIPSEYCSQRHREEATASGQATPCIMCKKMPRSQVDHFCSKTCLEKAMRA